MQQHIEENSFDVIIVGAGMVGSTLALALAKQGLQILLLDKFAFKDNWQEKYDIRVSAITRASQYIFENLNVWDAIKEYACVYENMQVWDASGKGEIAFSCLDIGEPNLGFIVENRVIQRALFNALTMHDNIQIDTSATINTLHIEKNQAILTLENEQKRFASLLVGADGKRSWVRENANIGITAKSYSQHALVTVVETAQDHQNTAWQSFFPEGPLAFLPLYTKNISAIVWSVSPNRAKTLCNISTSDFEQQLEQAFPHLGKITIKEKRAAFPLGTHKAQYYVQERLALIGDAAHSVHPLAGQGLNMGLLDAASLANVIQQQQQKKRDIGLQYNLNAYQRWRKAENLVMLTAMDGFQRLFSPQPLLLQQVRNYGMSWFNKQTLIKKILIQYAMGFEGHLPDLAYSRFL